MTANLFLASAIGLTASVSLVLAQGSQPTETPVATQSSQFSASPEAKSKSPSTPCEPVVAVCDLLERYAALTGFKIIRDNFVQGKLSIDDVSGLPQEKATEMIERSLFANHYAIVQIDAKTVQIVGTGQNPRTVGMPVVTKESDIPTRERVITYVFAFEHRSAVEMQQILGQYLSPPRAYTSLLASSSSNTVIATERTSVIRALVKIAAQMDVANEKTSANSQK